MHRCLISNRTEVFGLIFGIISSLDKNTLNLDFEVKKYIEICCQMERSNFYRINFGDFSSVEEILETP